MRPEDRGVRVAIAPHRLGRNPPGVQLVWICLYRLKLFVVELTGTGEVSELWRDLMRDAILATDECSVVGKSQEDQVLDRTSQLDAICRFPSRYREAVDQLVVVLERRRIIGSDERIECVLEGCSDEEVSEVRAVLAHDRVRWSGEEGDRVDRTK